MGKWEGVEAHERDPMFIQSYSESSGLDAFTYFNVFNSYILFTIFKTYAIDD